MASLVCLGVVTKTTARKQLVIFFFFVVCVNLSASIVFFQVSRTDFFVPLYFQQLHHGGYRRCASCRINVKARVALPLTAWKIAALTCEALIVRSGLCRESWKIGTGEDGR